METQTADVLAGSPADTASLEVVSSGQGRHADRLRRVHDYQAASLAKANPLEANLGSINSGLMRVTLWLDETIERYMESGPGTMERLQTITPAIETHLKVTRQVDRFAQIELRAAEARQPKTEDEVTSPPPSLPACDAEGSEESGI